MRFDRAPPSHPDVAVVPHVLLARQRALGTQLSDAEAGRLGLWDGVMAENSFVAGRTITVRADVFQCAVW